MRLRAALLAALFLAGLALTVPAIAYATSPPVASLVGRPASGYPCQPVILDASASYDPSGTLTTVEWDSGSGQFGPPIALPTGQPGVPPPSGLTDAVSFPSAGTYPLQVRVTDNSGLQTVAALSYTVNPAPPSPPVPMFSQSATQVLVGQTVSFDATGSYVSGFGPNCASTQTHQMSAYAWDFGDGTLQPAGSALTSHAYTAPGTYDVILEVAGPDPTAGLAAATHTVVVDAPPPATISLSSGRLREDTRDRVTVNVRCLTAISQCLGGVSLSAHTLGSSSKTSSVTLASARFSLRPGKSKTIRLLISRAGRTLVGKAGQKGLAATLAVAQTSTQATLTAVSHAVRILAPPPERPKRPKRPARPTRRPPKPKRH